MPSWPVQAGQQSCNECGERSPGETRCATFRHQPPSACGDVQSAGIEAQAGARTTGSECGQAAMDLVLFGPLSMITPVALFRMISPTHGGLLGTQKITKEIGSEKGAIAVRRPCGRHPLINHSSCRKGG